MKKSMFKLDKKETIILIVIAVTTLWRVLLAGQAIFPEIANFSALGAIALFSGAYLTRTKGLMFTMAALLISDLYISSVIYNGEYGIIYGGFLWVYAAFAMIMLTGRYLKANKNLGRFVASGALAVFIHWIVTDLGVWMGSALYPQTLEGFVACLVAAIPFEVNFLYGTFIYSSVLFGAIEMLKLRESNTEAVKQVA